MNPIAITKNYFKDAFHEMKRVVWPTKQQTKHYSIIVITLSIGLAVFFGILDYLFNIGLNILI